MSMMGTGIGGAAHKFGGASRVLWLAQPTSGPAFVIAGSVNPRVSGEHRISKIAVS
jgi:hypothetical protein